MHADRNSIATILHLITFATDGVGRLQSFWSREVLASAACDHTLSLQIHIGISSISSAVPKQISGAKEAVRRPTSWHLALLGKLQHALAVVNDLPIGSIAMFSDLDVQPLRSYSSLLPYLDEKHDFVIMQEPRPSASEEDVYNSGAWMLRVSTRTRALLSLWISKYDSRLHSARRGAFSDQTVLYQLLEQVAALKRGWTRGIQLELAHSAANLSQLAGLRVGTWPSDVVAGRVFPWLDDWRGLAGTPAHLPFPQNLQSLRSGFTVAYHAIALEWDPSIAPSQTMLTQYAQPRGRELKRDAGRFSARAASGAMTAQTASKIIAMYRVANYTRGVPVRIEWQPDREALRMHHFETRAKIASCCSSQHSRTQSDVCQQRTTSRIYRYSFEASRFQLRR